MFEEEEYEAERIVDQRRDLTGKRLFFVKWKGYPHEDNTWEPHEHLKNVPNIIKQWNKKLKDRSKNHQSKAVSLEYLLLDSESQDAMVDKKAKAIKKILQNQEQQEKRKDQKKAKKSKPKQSKIEQKSQKDKLQTSNSRQTRRSKQHSPQLSIIEIQLANFEEQSRLQSQKQESQLIEQSSQIKKQDQVLIPFYFRSQKSSSLLVITEDDQLPIQQNKQQELQMGYQNDKNNQLKRHKQISCLVIEEAQQENKVSEKFDNISQMVPQIPVKEEDIFREENIAENNHSTLNQFEKLQIQASSIRQNIDNIIKHEVRQENSIRPQKFIDFSSMKQIINLSKQNNLIYCQVLTKSSTLLENIPYDQVQQKRPDLVCSYFSRHRFLQQSNKHDK